MGSVSAGCAVMMRWMSSKLAIGVPAIDEDPVVRLDTGARGGAVGQHVAGHRQ